MKALPSTGPANGLPHIASYYAATRADAPDRAPLEGAHDTDICVIGGGFTGVSAALHLAERGYRVTLLEANRIGWGASGRNGGHVGIGQRKGQEELERRLGEDRARVLWDYSVESVRLVRDLIATHAIDCDLGEGILHVAARPGDAAPMRGEVEFLRTRYGFDGIEYVDTSELVDMLDSVPFHGAQLDRASAHLHPLNFVLGMAAAAEGAGATLCEASPALRIEHGKSPRVHTPRGKVQARYVLVGCNGYLGNLIPGMAGAIMPINNFMLATEPLPESLACKLIRDNVAVQDSLFVINYWKLSADNRLLFGGGENYTRRFPADIGRFVRKYMLRIYPQLSDTRIDYAWGGTLAITLNRMPDFGRLAPNVFYAQGYSGHGITTGTFAGRLLAEVVAGTAERFDVMAGLPIRRFPGGVLLRWPGLVLGMLYYSLRDKL